MIWFLCDDRSTFIIMRIHFPLQFVTCFNTQELGYSFWNCRPYGISADFSDTYCNSLIPYSFIVPTIYKYTVLTVEEVNYQYTYVYITVDMTATINPRELKGKVIAGKYKVILTKIGWTFSCPNHKFRGVKCRHIYAVEISYAIRRQVEVTRIEPLVNIHECIYCKSITIVKDGLRRNKSGDIQKFNCKSCHRYFTINIGFEKMKHNPQGVTTAMQLYFSGESLRNTSRSLKLIGMDVTH